MTQPLIAIIMGSKSDWETMGHATKSLDPLNIPYEIKIVSAHRTPDLLFQFAESAHERGIEVIIAGAGGAAHLQGMLAAKTIVPVLGVPVPSRHLQGLDSLLSIVVGMKTKSNIERIIESGGFIVTSECGPPRGADAEVIKKKGNLLKGVVDAVNVTDNQTSVVRMSSFSACLIQRDGI